MSYIVYTSDDLISALEDIYENLDSASSYLDDATSIVKFDMEDVYDYYNGKEFYEDLHFRDNITDIIGMVKQIDEQIMEFKKEWNEKMKSLKTSTDDRFKSQYKDAIIEVKE